MRKYEGIAAGVLGTVIIHLIAGIVFFSVKLHSLKKESEKEFLMVIEPETDKLSVHSAEDRQLYDDGIPEVDRMISNIVRNLLNPESPVIDPREYQDRVKEEMIRKGLLDEENFIDDWKKKETEQGVTEIIEKIKDEIRKEEEDAPPVNFQGETRVYYKLENRYHRKMPIPVYKCEGGGMVTLAIEVGRDGIVLNARVNTDESTTTEPCLLKTAVEYALMSLFNNSPDAPLRQTGSITYHFVAQK